MDTGWSSNLKRFPADFMFQLTKEAFDALRFQIETLENAKSLRLQNETLKTGRGQHSKYLPYVFTEQGVAMLSGVLNSDKAINMNIAIMRAFVARRGLASIPGGILLFLSALHYPKAPIPAFAGMVLFSPSAQESELSPLPEKTKPSAIAEGLCCPTRIRTSTN